MSLGSSIAGLFGQSPIRPLQEHYLTAHTCVATLEGFFNAVAKADWEAAATLQQQISELENHADEQKKQFRLGLPNSLFLPMPRTDLLDMIRAQDKVANRAKDIAGLMLGRQMSFPATLAPVVQSFLVRTIETSAQALTAVNELDGLIETGFSARTTRMIEQMIEELDRLERDTDDQQIALRAALYPLEAGLPPVDVIFLYRIIDWIGDLADRAQKVGGQLQTLLAH